MKVTAVTNCVKCRQPLRPDAKFCARCGEAVIRGLPLCSACGLTVRNGARFCPHCGRTISAVLPVTPASGSAVRPTFPRWLIPTAALLLVIFILMLGGLVGFYDRPVVDDRPTADVAATLTIWAAPPSPVAVTETAVPLGDE
jgi:hypothetical protein